MSDADHNADSVPDTEPTDNLPEHSDNALQDNIPMPNFDPDASDMQETSHVPFKSSPATPQDLNHLLTSRRSQDDSPQSVPPPTPVYKISSAEANLSSHVLPPDDEAEQPEEESTPMWKTIWAVTREVGETIILTLIIFFLIQFFIRNFRVVGTSMVNNLHDGQYLIIDKVSYNPYLHEYLGLGGPSRGDVIVFKPPRNLNEDYVKRVIGLPGEKVQVIKGEVYINDQRLDEPFEPVTGSYTMPSPVVVPQGQVFVLGDNRNNSNDSHNWGPLPIENIVGRAWISYWPPDQWGTIPRNAPTDEATLSHFVGQFVPSANAHNE